MSEKRLILVVEDERTLSGENRTEGGARFTVELPLDKEIQQEVDSYEDQG